MIKTPILTTKPDVTGRSLVQANITPENLPPLPEIKCRATRNRVFTHRSYYARPTHLFEDPVNDPSPDNEMLEHLGDSVLSLVITSLIRDVYPNLRVGASTKIRALLVGNKTLASISIMYKLHEELYAHPAQAITLRTSSNIQADLFESYVGGLFQEAGLETVKAWLLPLFRLFIHEAYRMVRIQHGLPPDPAPPSPTSSTASELSNPGTWPTPPPAARFPASVGHLSLFNQHLQQRCKSIEWVYIDSAGEGTKTTPIWVVRAMVEGECLGRGRGSTKKAAKNEAAKEGLKNMGINVP